MVGDMLTWKQARNWVLSDALAVPRTHHNGGSTPLSGAIPGKDKSNWMKIVPNESNLKALGRWIVPVVEDRSLFRDENP